jgi:hypothetical protein
MKYTKTSWLFIIFSLVFSFNTLLFADTSMQLDTVLTDKDSSNGSAKSVDNFSPNTPVIYLNWKSDQLKDGDKIKTAWIAEDTNNLAPPNYKIDETTLELTKEFKSKMLSSLPGSYWAGTAHVSKPNAGWPIGKYHVDVYVNDALIKSVKFSVVQDAAAASPATTKTEKSANGWDAISADATPYYGTGNGATKEEAEKNAQKFCTEAGGKECSVKISYQQCGAYAASAQSSGKGVGETKKTAEDQAMSDCKDSDCKIVVSDCNA